MSLYGLKNHQKSFMESISNFVKTHWSLLVALAAAVAFIYNKAREIWNEKKKKKQAYNRVFSAIIKMYFSYLRHKQLYSEETPLNFPDEPYQQFVGLADTFEEDLMSFKNAIMKETDVIPEVSFQAYMLFKNIEGFRIIDKIKTPNNNLENPSKSDELIVNRALFYAMEEEFDNFFENIIEDVAEHTSVKKSFIKKLKELNTQEFEEEMDKDRKNMIKRYFESLNRQGVMPDEVHNQLITVMQLN
jgi:hypothetical protein